MDNYIREIVLAGIGFAIGMAIGQFISFHRKGRRVVVEIEAKEVWYRIVKQAAWIIVVVVFVASVAQSVLFTYTQRECNKDVVDTLKYRAQLNSEVETINDERDKALRDLVQTILTAQNQPDPQKVVREALQQQISYTAELNKQSAERKKLRSEATIPDCG